MSAGYDYEEDNEDEVNVVFRDTIFLALAGFVSIVLLLIPFINPPTKKEASIEPPGSVIVEIRWPDKIDADVDLWVQAPGDVPVGYSNKGGILFNLLRDDLGKYGDATELNYENAYTRGIVAGEYTVNLHLFRNTEGTYPVPVRVVVSLRATASSSTFQILQSDVNLKKEGEEITVFRFSLQKTSEERDDAWTHIPDSVHSIFKPLRSAAVSGSRYNGGTP